MNNKILKNFSLLLFMIILFTQCKQYKKTDFANVNGTKIYYEISGTGTPIVFLHGFTCDHRNWNPQVEFFSKNYQVITYDARGHGKSDVPDTVPYTYDEDLAALMDYLKIDKAVIVGHSMGGAPAFYYTYNNPDRVLALVLAEGGPFINDPAIIDTVNLPDYFSEFYKAIKIARKEGLEKGKEAWLNIHPMKTAAENPQSSELLKQMINDYSGWHWFNRDPHRDETLNSVDYLKQINTPTLIFAGELSHKALRDLVILEDSLIKNSQLVILKNSNHMLNIENPDQFNKELLQFLKENNIK